jgi:D-alanyl-D-alanine carboxypeptidase/D-alanyl-D-alanine-endopeptidase (penicillin-binding protein 4)
MRWRLASFGAAVVVVAASGAVYVATQASDGSPSQRPPSPASVPPTPEPVLATLAADAPTPTPAGVARQLRQAAVAPALGGALSGLVVDATAGTLLFARRPDATAPPASTTKLLTAVAALETLGPDARLTTAVVRAGRTLYLVGGGDVTLAAAKRDTYPTPATLQQLAARTVAALPGATFTLRYDDSLWRGPTEAAGWQPDYVSGGDVSPVSALEVDEGRLTGFTSLHPQPRVTDPAASAAAAFGKALVSAGVRLKPGASRGTAPHVAPVATVRSPPVSELVQRMLTDSDNDLAEALARSIAVHEHLPASFIGAARAITATLRDDGLPVDTLRLHDGSGLSRLDRVSPRLLVAVLRLIAQRPELRPINEGVPVAGFTGTLTERYHHGVSRAGAGVVRAKTGTLAGVNTLAGTVVDADGRLLVFAFLTNRASDPDSTEQALDALAARLAECGCR